MIPALYLCISDTGVGDLTPITHIAPVRRPVPQVVEPILQGRLRGEGREGGRGNDGSSGRRHCDKRLGKGGKSGSGWLSGRKSEGWRDRRPKRTGNKGNQKP